MGVRYMISKGMSKEEICSNYPDTPHEDVFLAYKAAELLDEDQQHYLSGGGPWRQHHVAGDDDHSHSD